MTLQVAFLPQLVMHPPPGQSISQSEELAHEVMHPPPVHEILQSADVPQFVVHLPELQATEHSLDVSHAVWQSCVVQLKSHSFETEHLQLAPLHNVLPDDDDPDVPLSAPEVPPSPSPLPIVKSYVQPAKDDSNTNSAATAATQRTFTPRAYRTTGERNRCPST